MLVGRGGEVKGHENCEQRFCEQIGVSYLQTLGSENHSQSNARTAPWCRALRVLGASKVVRALDIDPFLIEKATDDLKADGSLMLAAVHKDWRAFQLASEDLRADKDARINCGPRGGRQGKPGSGVQRFCQAHPSYGSGRCGFGVFGAQESQIPFCATGALCQNTVHGRVRAKMAKFGKNRVFHHFGCIGFFVVGHAEVVCIIVAVPARVRFYLDRAHACASRHACHCAKVFLFLCAEVN